MTDVLIMAAAQSRRAWLGDVLGKEPAIRLTGTAPTLPFLRSMMNEIEADVALIELDPASESTFNEEWLAEFVNLAKIVILSSGPAASVLATLVRAEQGALLRSDASREQILHTLKAVSTGLLVIDPSLISKSELSSEPAEALTARENEVLGLLAEGLANREIASRLNISEHTIKFHIGSILAKLGASSRTEAVTRGLRSGLIEL